MICNPKSQFLRTKIPHVLHWMDVKVGNYMTSSSFNKNMVI